MSCDESAGGHQYLSGDSLNQSASRTRRDFLEQETGVVWISDFSLHSLGVLLFRRRRFELFRQFIADVLPELTILTLSKAGYSKVLEGHEKLGLDFDDAFQFAIAKENKLAIATRDRDFERVKNEITVIFI